MAASLRTLLAVLVLLVAAPAARADTESLDYWTLLGGSGSETAYAVEVDAAGAAYVAGTTSTASFPGAGGYDGTLNGGDDVFVAKIAPDGNSIEWWTFLGGTGRDQPRDLAIDGTGAVYVTGFTESPTTFPSADRSRVAPGYDQTYNGGFADAFVVKIAPGGATLDSWTFLGGSATSSDTGQGIAVDPAGAAYVTGVAGGATFPSVEQPKAVPGYDQTFNQAFGTDAFAVKLLPSGTSLAYWTFLGGNAIEVPGDVAVDAQGAAYLTGRTQSALFPSQDKSRVAPGWDQTYNGGAEDVYAAKLDPSGSALAWWTFLGGAGQDQGFGVAVDGAGAAYVSGLTLSPSFPSGDRPKGMPGWDQTYGGGNSDGFLVKLEPGGAAPQWWTFVGGSQSDDSSRVAVDASGAAHLTGMTQSANFPSDDGTRDAPGYDQTPNGAFEAYYVKVEPSGLGPAYWTFLGGSGNAFESGFGVAAGPGGSAYVAGTTGSATFPSADEPRTAPGYDQLLSGVSDAFAVRLATADDAPATLTLSPAEAQTVAGEEHCVTAAVTNGSGGAVEGVVVTFTVTGANAASGSAETDAGGEAVSCYAGTVAGTDTIEAVAAGGSEPRDTATNTYVAGPPAALALTPASAQNVVGEEHCVSASVRDEHGNPAGGVPVTFTVTGTHAGSGASATDADGTARHCYTGVFAGEDTIVATASGGSSPSATATNRYVLPASTCGAVKGSGRLDTSRRVHFAFNADLARGAGPGTPGHVGVRDHVAGVTFRSTSIDAVVIDGDRATVYGRGVAGGEPVQFRLTADDADPDRFRILLSDGYEAGGDVIGGKVEIDRRGCGS